MREKKVKNKKVNRIIKVIVFGAIFILGIILLILPADYFDHGDSVCLSVVFFDLACYGCGMTRAVQHLLHFNFEEAYYYNRLSFIVLPLLIYLIIVEFIKFLKEIKADRSEVN